MRNSENYNEQELAIMLKQKNPVAMKAMYNRYAGYLAAVCSRYILSEEDQKDVLQDSFIKIFTSAGQFEYRRDGSLKAWATRIVVNESLKLLKQQEKFNITDQDTDFPEQPEEEPPETEDIPAEAIHTLIRQLPAGYRTILNLYVFENKSHKEIAALLNIKEDTSASQLHKAKNILAKKIKTYKSACNGRTVDR